MVDACQAYNEYPESLKPCARRKEEIRSTKKLSSNRFTPYTYGLLISGDLELSLRADTPLDKYWSRIVYISRLELISIRLSLYSEARKLFSSAAILIKTDGELFHTNAKYDQNRFDYCIVVPLICIRNT